MSSLVFGISMASKFEYAKDQTFGSRQYKYAVDLYSPTSQGGQYIPISGDGDNVGESGFINTESEGKN
ncbi:hypothetical protein FACS1894218_2110 [Bacilli bacterium]|nr:hypothetical protein FACS1894218_2110 [Bacilli bacterium]